MKTVYAVCEPQKVVLKEKDLPKPGKGEVLLKAKYSAMSPGTEKGLMVGARGPLMEAAELIGVRLSNYRLLKTDFYVLQDALQKEIEEKDTFRECHAAVMKYYESIAAEICHSEKHRDKSSIEKIKKYIKENYKEDITMKELAKMSSVSENYFSAMFKRETGKNYKTYLTDVRMEAAIELLMTSDMKAYEIGFEVGYNNARRFVDTFKERYGISPSEYKKRLKNQ